MPPPTLHDKEVLGFLLKVTDEIPPLSGPEIKFVPSGTKIGLLPWESAWEWHNDTQAPGGLSSSRRKRAFTRLSTPLARLGRFVESKSGMERGRWPTPHSRLARNFVDIISGTLGGFHHPFGMIALVIITILTLVGGVYLISMLAQALIAVGLPHLPPEMIRPLIWLLGGLLEVVAIAVGIIVALGILIFVHNFLFALGNFFFLRSTRRILYGLVMTYIAGPGAPTWVEKQDNIIALPIPPTVTTLSFNIPPEERQRLITKAREVTLQKLNKILGSEGSVGKLVKG